MRDRPSPRVLVAHPGTQHSYQTALGLQESSLLHRYVTGFYYKRGPLAAAALGLVPVALGKRLERELQRRHHAALDPGLIETSPLRELLYVLSARERRLRPFAGSLIRWRNARFDAKVARMVRIQRPEAAICYDGCAVDTFRSCQSVGTLRILDQSVGHLKGWLELMKEEATLHPDFADSLHADAPAWLVEQCLQEALAADAILAPSEYVRDSLVRVGVAPERVKLLPYGVDTSRFQPLAGPRDGPFRILFVGSIGQRKGIKYLLEAFTRLNLPNAELTLVGGVVGSGRGLAPYAEHFRHVPNVPHHEVHAWFQRADLFVYPSLHEGSALAIYEALASGVPVITTPHAGSVVRDGEEGFVVPIRDVDALMAAIARLYRDRVLREEMGRKARLRAEAFTWPRYRQALGRVVGELIGEHRA